MRIRNSEGDRAPDHELVPAPENGPSKASDRRARTSSERRTGPKAGMSYAMARIVSSWPSTTGGERFRETRKRIHSSSTSRSSSRHSSTVEAFASTPSKP